MFFRITGWRIALFLDHKAFCITAIGRDNVIDYLLHSQTGVAVVLVFLATATRIPPCRGMCF